MPPDLLRILMQLLQDPENKFTMLLAGRGLSEFLKDIQKMTRPPQGVRLEGMQQPGVRVAPSAQGAPLPPDLMGMLAAGQQSPLSGAPQQQLASQLAQMQTTRRGTGMLGGGRL